MNPAFLHPLNSWAILVSAAAYWFIGAFWYSTLPWGTEIEKHGVKIKDPTKPELVRKLVTTFLLNLIVVAAVAWVGAAANVRSVVGGLGLGLLLGLGLSAATFGIASTWESRSLKLTLI